MLFLSERRWNPFLRPMSTHTVKLFLRSMSIFLEWMILRRELLWLSWRLFLLFAVMLQLQGMKYGRKTVLEYGILPLGGICKDYIIQAKVLFLQGRRILPLRVGIILCLLPQPLRGCYLANILVPRRLNKIHGKKMLRANG